MTYTAQDPDARIMQVIDSNGTAVPMVFSYDTITKTALIYIKGKSNKLICSPQSPIMVPVVIPGSKLINKYTKKEIV